MSLPILNRFAIINRFEKEQVMVSFPNKHPVLTLHLT